MAYTRSSVYGCFYVVTCLRLLLWRCSTQFRMRISRCSGERIALASVTAPTLLNTLSKAAANNEVELCLLPQTDIDLGNIKTEFTLQHDQIFIVKHSAAQLDSMS